MYGRSAGGPQLHDEHPPARAHHQRDAARAQVAQPPPPADRRREQPHRRQRGQHEERLQHLGEEAERRPASRPAAASGCRRVSTARSVAYAAPTSSSTSSASGLLNRKISTATGRQGERRAGEQRRRPWRAGARARGQRGAAHRRVEQRRPSPRPSAPAATRTLHERQPEDPHREAVDPQRRGRLVDGDRVRGVGRAEEPRLPARARGLRRGGVEGVGPPGAPTAPRGRARGRRQQARRARACRGREVRPVRGGGGVVRRGRDESMRGAWTVTWSPSVVGSAMCAPSVAGPVRQL